MRKRAIVVGLVVGLGCGNKKDDAAGTVVPPPAAKPVKAGEPTQAEYAALLIAELKKRGLKGDLHFDAEKSMITDGEMQLSTTNIYAEYLKVEAADRPAALAKVAGTFSDMDSKKDPPLADVKAKLLPAVRAGMYFDFELQLTDAKAPAEAHEPWFVPIGEFGAVGIAIDQADSMQIATDKQIAAWGIGLDEALAIATKNLAEKGVPFQRVAPGVWTSPAHDNYDSSRLLLLEEIGKLGLKGTPVALIPNRDTIFLAGSDDGKALIAMADLAEKAMSEPRPIHTVPLCLTGKTWSDCEPGPTPAVKTRMHALATIGRQSLYQDQHDPLEKKLGEDVFVANYTVLQDKDGKRLVSYATWTRTVPTMLPKADLVGFVEVSGDDPDAKPKVLGMVPWDRVMKVVGTHMKPDGRSPQRWATGSYFPTAAELATLAPSENPFR